MRNELVPFSEWLRGQLKKTGMTQATLALRTDMDPGRISRYACGDSEPSYLSLLRIVDAFGLELKTEKKGK